MNIEKGKINYRKTVFDIFDYADKYKDDIPENLVSLPLEKYYKFLKNIPYVPDGFDPKTGEGIEVLHRPSYLLNGSSLSCDCDDKTVLAGAYANKNKIPWGLGVSGKKQPEHVFPIFYLNKNSLIFDGTYPENDLGNLYPKNPGYLEIFLERLF